jgi:hypothetical protein
VDVDFYDDFYDRAFHSARASGGAFHGFKRTTDKRATKAHFFPNPLHFMRRFLAILLIAACAVKAFPAEHPAHRRAEDVVDTAAATAWNVGTEAVETAREALRERNRRDSEDGGDGRGDRRSREENDGEDPSGREKFFGTATLAPQ